MRSRNSEQNNKAIQRALKIQQTCSDLITKEKNAIIIDRSHLDFTKYDDVRFVFNNIKHKIYVTRTS